MLTVFVSQQLLSYLMTTAISLALKEGISQSRLVVLQIVLFTIAFSVRHLSLGLTSPPQILTEYIVYIGDVPLGRHSICRIHRELVLTDRTGILCNSTREKASHDGVHHNLGWLGRRISLALYLPRIPVYLDAMAFLRRSHLYQRPCTRLLRYIRHTMSNTL